MASAHQGGKYEFDITGLDGACRDVLRVIYERGGEAVTAEILDQAAVDRNQLHYRLRKLEERDVVHTYTAVPADGNQETTHAQLTGDGRQAIEDGLLDDIQDANSNLRQLRQELSELRKLVDRRIDRRELRRQLDAVAEDFQGDLADLRSEVERLHEVAERGDEGLQERVEELQERVEGLQGQVEELQAHVEDQADDRERVEDLADRVEQLETAVFKVVTSQHDFDDRLAGVEVALWNDGEERGSEAVSGDDGDIEELAELSDNRLYLALRNRARARFRKSGRVIEEPISFEEHLLRHLSEEELRLLRDRGLVDPLSIGDAQIEKVLSGKH